MISRRRFFALVGLTPAVVPFAEVAQPKTVTVSIRSLVDGVSLHIDRKIRPDGGSDLNLALQRAFAVSPTAAHTNRSGEAVAATPAPLARPATASHSSPIADCGIGQALAVVDEPASLSAPVRRYRRLVGGAGSPKIRAH
jgi:hypothetical protein